ncbi:MAG: glycosyltransferase family 4 protein [Proteobacteria bacterium]|jgi:glycosyltransferase involved in cell wall biosynthesis|nr:glycosyltransferase family 4 protein [Pseudomonadota bacterium]
MRQLSKNLRLLVFGTPWIDRLLRSIARKSAARSNKNDVYDLVFVTPPSQAEGWILDAICKEMGERLSSHKIAYCRSGETIPLSHRYFFSHYMFYLRAVSAGSAIFAGRSFVYATHLEPRKHAVSTRALARLLGCVDGVICMNSGLRQELAHNGVPFEKMKVVVGAANSDIYRPHIRQEDGIVGFCSAYYERKSPDLVFDIVRRLPHRRFVLLGKGWHAYTRFKELSSQSNFEYVETAYTNYANFYAQMSVFVSVSQLEGGPIPLVEAMMSNVVPVASRTGFAPDIIKSGENGFLFDVGAPASLICEMIEQAFGLSVAVSESVRHFNWDTFTETISREIGLSHNS